MGSIGVQGGNLTAGYASAGVKFASGASALLPHNISTGSDTDGTLDLGTTAGSTRRWRNLYLSGGVYLGGTGAANKLDDYEEGTWTPSYVPLSGSFTTLTYSQRVGYYTKIGRFVFVTGYIFTSEVDATGAASSLTIQGLPFTFSAGAGRGTASVGDARSWNISTGIETPRLYFSSGRIEMSKHAANSAFASVVPSDMLSGVSSFANGLAFSGCYFTD